MWMKKAMVAALGVSVLLAVTACTNKPKLDPYEPGCSTRQVRTWDSKQNKWVKVKKTTCSLGNIY